MNDETPKSADTRDPMTDTKTTAPPTMPALSPREAARLWGTGTVPGPRRPQKFPYSKM
jgi:hypothetical protein